MLKEKYNATIHQEIAIKLNEFDVSKEGKVMP